MSIILSLVLAASAAKVYRCDTDGEIVFQQSPCVMADEPVALRPESSFGEPEVDKPGAKRPKQPTSRTRSARGGATGGPKHDAACETARAKREAAYAERGNTMSFDERRKLQDLMD